MKLITALFLMILICLSIKANDLDSLKVSHKNAKGAELINLAKIIGIEYYKRSVYDSAIYFYNSGLEEAKRLQDYESAGKISNNLGVIEYIRGYPAKAILSYKETLKFYQKTENDTLIGNAYINLGLAYKKLAIYNKALLTLQDGVRVLESLNDRENLPKGLNAIGNIYKTINDTDRAFEYHNRSLELKQKEEDLKGIAVSLQNLGLIHSKLNQIDSAMSYFQKSLDIKRSLSDSLKLIPSTLSQMGEMYMILGDYRQSEKLLQESFELRMKNHDAIGVAVGANQLVKFYLDQDLLSKALIYLKIAEEFIEKTGALNEKERNQEFYLMYYEKAENWREALKYSQLLLITRDSILNKEKIVATERASVEYEVERVEYELAAQKVINSQSEELLRISNIRIYWLVATLFLAVIAVIILVRSYKLKKNLAEEKAESELRVKKLLKELHHRTGNHLQLQMSMIQLQANEVKDESTRYLINIAENRMKAVAMVHQSLYSATEDDPTEKIQLTNYLKNLVENLMISFRYNRNKLEINYQMELLDIELVKAVPVGLIINEAITNAFKYAFADHPSPYLEVILKKDEQQLVVLVKDNGLGSEEDDHSGKSALGSLLMKDLTKQLHGKLEITDSDGRQVKLIVPFADS